MWHTRYGDGEHMLKIMLYMISLYCVNLNSDKMIMSLNCNGMNCMFNNNNFFGVFGLSPSYPSLVYQLFDLAAKKCSYYINGKVIEIFFISVGMLHMTLSTLLKIDETHY